MRASQVWVWDRISISFLHSRRRKRTCQVIEATYHNEGKEKSIALKNERYYLYQLAGGTIRFKNILRKKCGKLEPMIQMEIMKGSKWLPMLRCDRSHSFLHIDLYDCRSGKKTRRDLSGKDACSAIVEIVGLLKQDWRKLFEELHCYKIIDYFTNNRESLNALDDARTYLLNEAERPHSLVGSKRKGANAFSNNASLRRESEDLTCTKKK